MLSLITALFALSPGVACDRERDELHAVWKRIIDLAHADKVGEVEKIVRGWKLHRQEFAALFGEENAGKAYAKFEKHWAGVEQKTALAIVKRIRNKNFDGVEVICLNTARADQLTADERSALIGLHDKGVKLYSVHFRARHSTAPGAGRAVHKGYVVATFVKAGAHWRLGLKLGAYLKTAKHSKKSPSTPRGN